MKGGFVGDTKGWVRGRNERVASVIEHLKFMMSFASCISVPLVNIKQN